MKRILCFGDSLTWGYDPAKRVRFEEDSRWPCVMQAALGDDYKVIEEGRTAGRSPRKTLPKVRRTGSHTSVPASKAILRWIM